LLIFTFFLLFNKEKVIHYMYTTEFYRSIMLKYDFFSLIKIKYNIKCLKIENVT
jgi:hypothetical protein